MLVIKEEAGELEQPSGARVAETIFFRALCVFGAVRLSKERLQARAELERGRAVARASATRDRRARQTRRGKRTLACTRFAEGGGLLNRRRGE